LDDFRKKLRELQHGEVNSILDEVLRMTAQSAAEGEAERRTLADRILRLWSEREQQSRRSRLGADEMRRHVHIVFALSDAGSLKVTLSELGKRLENEVLAFNDLFSVGPIGNLDQEEGQRCREQWMNERFPSHRGSSFANRENRIEQMIQTLGSIPESKSVTIWCADNAHDQTGLRFALHLLGDRKGPVRVVNASDACKSFSPYAGDEPPYALGLIPRERYGEIVGRFELLAPMEADERRQYEAEWLELCGQAHTLRFWRNGRIVGVAEEVLDSGITGAVRKLRDEVGEDGFVKAGRVVAEVFEHTNQLIGDSFLSYRMWRLISDGVLEFKGLPGELYQYAVRLR
jgi:hypothetical protein